MNFLQELAKTGVQSGGKIASGDQRAIAKAARKFGPHVLKAMFPGLGPIVDIGAGFYDGIAHPDALADVDPDELIDVPGINRFTKKLLDMDHGIVLMEGRQGSGKTTTMARLCQLWGRPAFTMNVEKEALAGTCYTYCPIDPDSIYERQPGEVVMIPDAGSCLDSRKFGSDMDETVRKLAQFIRKLGLILLLDFQNSSLLSKSAFECRVILHKQLSQAWKVVERQELRGLATISQKAISMLSEHDRLRHVFAFCDEANFAGLVPVRMPEAPWYSKAFSLSKGDQAVPKPRKKRQEETADGYPADLLEGEYTIR